MPHPVGSAQAVGVGDAELRAIIEAGTDDLLFRQVPPLHILEARFDSTCELRPAPAFCKTRSVKQRAQNTFCYAPVSLSECSYAMLENSLCLTVDTRVLTSTSPGWSSQDTGRF